MKLIMLLMSFIKSLFTLQKPVVESSNLPLRLNLQFFADPTDPPTDPVDPPADPVDSPAKIEFTTEQQTELDRILGDRLGKAQAKWEKEFNTKLKDAKTEAEKLATMNAVQKADYERQQQELKLTDREADITRRELRASALETLAEKGLPKQLAEILVFTDADSTSASLDAVEKAFRESVEAGVNERLRGDKAPGGGGKSGAETSVGANFAKSLNEKSKPVATTLWG
ncbi:DUF4355 domain-containing protein [Sporosarcina sp. FA9]|uniref:DUF4355 domain-containing protein n=1 Tax=Sporosarcina sp. FA9 TaxID=3413030 RepID=UPI003F65C476